MNVNMYAVARRRRKGDASFVFMPKQASPLVVFFACCSLSALVVGCAFDGYVPKGVHKPVAEEERSIQDLRPGTPAVGELDCKDGRCRVRHRIHIGAAGRLEIRVDGPRGPDESQEPRLARAMLQDVNGRVVARDDVEQESGPMLFAADVTPGPYFVLIQGLGGELRYEVAATLTGASGEIVSPMAGVPAAAMTGPDSAAANSRPPRSAPGAGAQAPGDTSDGADFAFDPTADFTGMRDYAFAENPQGQLEGTEAEGRGNPFVIRQIQREIRYALDDSGLQQVEAAEADFLISVQVGSKATTWYSMSSMPQTTSYDSYFSRWQGMGGFINPHTYVDGTLTIDLIDPKSGQLIWHGWTTEPVNTKIDDKTLLKGAVQAVLNQFDET